MYEWITDGGQTPQIVVDASIAGVVVPREFVQNGKIVLNVSHAATRDLNISNDTLECEARFGGKPFGISVPIGAVLGIYAKESGQGMLFGSEEGPEPDKGGNGSRPRLRVVK